MTWSKIYREVSERIASMRSILDNLAQLSPDMAEELKNVPDVAHIDLWRQQPEYPDAEHPLRLPAVFIGLGTPDTQDGGALVQNVRLQVDLYVWWETSAASVEGASSVQDSALNCLDLLTALNVLFHGYTGTEFSTLRKTGVQYLESGGKGHLYRISFECVMSDYSAQDTYATCEIAGREVAVSSEPLPQPAMKEDGLYDVGLK